MAEPSPTEPPEGQEPEELEGKKPAVAAEPATEPEPEAKTYPESYVRQLRAELGTRRKSEAEALEKLQEIEDANKSEHQKAIARAEKAERERDEVMTGLLRHEVAAEHGLEKWASFLHGSTREEMEHRAEELTGLLAEQQTPVTTRSASFDGGARVPAPQSGKPEEEHNDFLMRALGRAPNR
jgi:thioesterase domain-containing protein